MSTEIKSKLKAVLELYLEGIPNDYCRSVEITLSGIRRKWSIVGHRIEKLINDKTLKGNFYTFQPTDKDLIESIIIDLSGLETSVIKYAIEYFHHNYKIR